jgi:hypothetical protein
LNMPSNLSVIGIKNEPVEYPVNVFAILNFRIACEIPRI